MLVKAATCDMYVVVSSPVISTHLAQRYLSSLVDFSEGLGEAIFEHHVSLAASLPSCKFTSIN